MFQKYQVWVMNNISIEKVREKRITPKLVLIHFITRATCNCLTTLIRQMNYILNQSRIKDKEIPYNIFQSQIITEIQH